VPPYGGQWAPFSYVLALLAETSNYATGDNHLLPLNLNQDFGNSISLVLYVHFFTCLAINSVGLSR